MEEETTFIYVTPSPPIIPASTTTLPTPYPPPSYPHKNSSTANTNQTITPKTVHLTSKPPTRAPDPPADIQAAEASMDADADLRPFPGATRIPWPSELAQTPKPNQRPTTCPLPAPKPRKARPPPLDLKPWEIYDHRERGLGLATAVGPPEPNTDPPATHEEATIGHGAPKRRTLEPLPPEPPDDDEESSESHKSTLPPKRAAKKTAGKSCFGCGELGQKSSGDGSVCDTCEWPRGEVK